jgi:phage-related protein
VATFPTLKTGAVAQYPLSYGTRFSTQAVRFLDGSQQRFRLIGNPLRQWSIKLDQLDDEELGAVIAFVEQQGSALFAFTDPATGVQVATCAISGEQFDAGMKGEMNGQTTIELEEIA